MLKKMYPGVFKVALFEFDAYLRRNESTQRRSNQSKVESASQPSGISECLKVHDDESEVSIVHR